jgi:hypothetical protein
VVVPPRHWIPRSGNPLEEEEPSPTHWF